MKKKLNGNIYKMTCISATENPKVLKLVSSDCFSKLISLYSSINKFNVLRTELCTSVYLELRKL